MPAPSFQRSRLQAQAMSAYRAGEFARAAMLFGRLVKTPGRSNPELLYMLGMTQVHSGDFVNGRRHLQRAIRMAPRQPHYHAQLAVTYQQEGDLAEALRCCERGLRIDPEHPAALTTKADVLWLRGDYRQAYELLEPYAARAGAYPGLVIRFARLARRFDEPARGIELLEGLLAGESLAPFHRRTALFRLGELLEGTGRYDEAFAAYAQANEQARPAFDAAAHGEAVGRLVSSWSRAALERQPRATVLSARPILIVGMMRSGTTLTEQILASHPQVAAGGELPALGTSARTLLGSIGTDAAVGIRVQELDPAVVDAAASAYLDAIGRVSAAAERITDKTPHNFYLLGVADLLLPGARVVHCTRDPLDTCLSCFFQDLGPHQHPAGSDLAALGVYYRCYREVMEHWRTVLRLPVLEFPYERLVEDQEGRTRALLEFVGLPFDEACLRFHETDRAAVTMSSEQVRRTLYGSSVGRWRHYDRHLGPLRTALG